MGTKPSKKSRKHGRGKRKPSHIRYNAEGRYWKNKARKQAKHQKQIDKKKERLSASNH